VLATLPGTVTFASILFNPSTDKLKICGGIVMFDLIYRFDPNNPDVRKPPMTSEEARLLLVQGNRDFAEMTDINRTGKEERIIPLTPGHSGGVAAGEVLVRAVLPPSLMPDARAD
jgi:hypothetical protein